MVDYECCITTVDNPFIPFDDFIKWYLFDCEKGYNTCSYLARIAKTSEELSDSENIVEIERAIDDIIKHDHLNIYKKVTQMTGTRPKPTRKLGVA